MDLGSWIDLIMCFVLFLLFIYIFASVTITRLHKVYLGFHFSMMIWPYCQFAIKTVDDPVFQLFYVKAAFVDASLLIAGWIFFTILISGQSQFLKRKLLILLFLPAVFSSLGVILNPYEWFVRPVNGGYVERIYGPIFWINISILVIHALVSLYIIYVALVSDQASRIKNQIMSMLRGILAVTIFLLLDILLNVVLDDYLPVIPGFTSLGIVISAIFFVITIHQDKVFDIVTIAHQDIIDTMEYGILVLDDQERVVEMNQALHPYSRLRPGDRFQMEAFLPGTTDAIRRFLDQYRERPDEMAEIECLHPGAHLYISIHAAPIMVSSVRVGRTITFQDITELRRLIDETNHQNTILQERNESLIKVQEELFQTNRKLTKMAITDSLTKCYNRHYLTQQLEREVTESRDHPFASAMILIDIDFFKAVNDRYGHLAGDLVICGTVEVLQRLLREKDILARYGGEEFIIYLPDTKEAEAFTIAKQLKSAVAANKMIIDNVVHPVSVTISMGVLSIADFKAGQPKDASAYLNDLFKTVDNALYAAKHQGRNRIVSVRR
ncbi:MULTISPECIES: diguanylate cyclase [unclassified Paenibacillus]|uniref:histidine kinase N-terminal 7TM domain-containing diguanylate cyclase n=1 Tax=unclassified Paenibacillus TaxID=185978 RepID=UPI002404AB93|nr:MULTISPECIES: diguanylate cyclase [unclassified Paenibacillus]MDF9839836.1 two-component system cell cycle response regulator [Paenibacillus sp. PastF-2]MDF9846417.1 two-component system cell cycle response regulator [Paenibacillus sp. PastM-2]MDF9853234.1 two-component system cell cycle response regulator [Paenibacillus sp. PastF-1]MDH6478262.1 two-component system cell cycle response regulator [Paenibacillus sp. PastH-2]MDH6506239.1 two-component system cell cycle response regulator [Paen